MMAMIGSRTKQVPLCYLRTLSSPKHWTLRTGHTAAATSIKECAYTSVDKFPPLSTSLLRVYSMRFCPYGQRARLVLEHKQVRYEVVNISLADKPAWFLHTNPDGTVPVVEHNGKVVRGSANCMVYLDHTYPVPALLPAGKDCEKAALELMKSLDQIPDKYYNVLSSQAADREAAIDDFHKELDMVEKGLTTPFLFGDKLSLVDYYIWPFFERIPLLQQLSDHVIMAKSRYPGLSSWVAGMRTTHGVKGTCFSPDQHLAYQASTLSGKADYDLGLQQCK